MKYKSAKKPDKCPECGSIRIANILYGLPVFSSQLRKEKEEGKIVLGGCCVSNDDPSWQCVNCNTLIHRMKIDLSGFSN